MPVRDTFSDEEWAELTHEARAELLLEQAKGNLNRYYNIAISSINSHDRRRWNQAISASRREIVALCEVLLLNPHVVIWETEQQNVGDVDNDLISY